jgi:hypothetical protein
VNANAKGAEKKKKNACVRAVRFLRSQVFINFIISQIGKLVEKSVLALEKQTAGCLTKATALCFDKQKSENQFVELVENLYLQI